MSYEKNKKLCKYLFENLDKEFISSNILNHIPILLFYT